MGAKSLNNMGRQRATVPTVIGRCKVYGDPIRTGDDTVWLSNPMGLSHRECKDRADEVSAAGRSVA